MMYHWLTELGAQGFQPGRILDIGAWNGVWTRTVREIWPDAHYTCIEAGRKHLPRLEQTADEVHIAVVGDRNRTVKMYLREIDKGTRKKTTYTKGSTIFGIFPDSEPRQMQTLQDIVGAEATYDLIKQDIQGAELLTIAGSPRIFQRARYVINEVNTEPDPRHSSMPWETEMDRAMERLGFDQSRTIEHKESVGQKDKIYFRSCVSKSRR